MKNILFLALSFSFIFLHIKQQAQVSNYTFTQTLGNYGSVNTGTTVGGTLQDDDVNTVAIGFPFVFNGTTYNNINVCSNGYLSFTGITGFEIPPISDATTQNLIAPFGQDIFMGSVVLADMTAGSNTLTNCSSVNGFSVGDVIFDWGPDFGGFNPTVTAISGNNIVVNILPVSTITGYDVVNMNGYIKQNVTGVSPNRICEFEYANFTRLSVYDEVINFKVKLYETSNRIEFVYGNMIVGQDATPSEVGLKGNNNLDYNSRKVNAPVTWSNSVASTAISDVCDFAPPAGPAAQRAPLSGQSYLWGPPTCTIPVLIIVQSNSVICSGASVTLAVGGAVSYTWANGVTNSVLVVSPTSNTSYSVVGANGTCTNAVSITQSVVPNPTITITQTNTLICKGQSATLTANGASSYSWNTGISVAQLVVTPTVTTTYTVTGISGICIGTNTIVQNVSACTAIAAKNFDSAELQVYPNPFNTYLSIKNTGDNELKITIIDALGKKVYNSVIKGDSVQTINTDFLYSGFYFITVSGFNNETYTRKLIKE